MNKEVFITDAQFIEGFAGTFGQILSYYFFHDIVFKNKDKNYYFRIKFFNNMVN